MGRGDGLSWKATDLSNDTSRTNDEHIYMLTENRLKWAETRLCSTEPLLLGIVQLTTSCYLWTYLDAPKRIICILTKKFSLWLSAGSDLTSCLIVLATRHLANRKCCPALSENNSLTESKMNYKAAAKAKPQVQRNQKVQTQQRSVTRGFRQLHKMSPSISIIRSL